MYYPFFRGKQFELLAIRESAQVIADAKFVPIIEPVRETLTGLDRALQKLGEHGAAASVIVNPHYGDHKHDGSEVATYLERQYRGNDAVSPALLLTSSMTTADAMSIVSRYEDSPFTLIHAGFVDGKGLGAELKDTELTNVFLDVRNTLYRRHFQQAPRILVEDGFKREKNADYGLVDRFSELHVTYRDLGGDGHGDFLTIGDYFAEGGGPAYAVAIHLTYIDPDQEDAMFVCHFVSDTNDTPVDPAGKFSQALNKLIAHVDDPASQITPTSAVDEFRELHLRGHFPGLGYVKKLAIKHHLETLATYHANARTPVLRRMLR